jgi:hypothetical protein
MSVGQDQFLSLLGHPPARLTVEQTAWVLNCQLHDIPILIASKLVKPLGNPPANGIKFFATTEILEAARDRHWLAKVTASIYQHWQKKNQRKRSKVASSATDKLTAFTGSLQAQGERS